MARLAGKIDTGVSDQVLAEKDVIPQAAPLRQPYSPAAKPQRREEDAVPDLTGPKKPAQNNKQDAQQRNNRGPRNFNNNNSFHKNRPAQERMPPRQDSQDENEDWGSKPAAPAPAPAPASPAPKPSPAPAPPAPPRLAAAAPRAPGSVADTMPAKGGNKLVPANYLVELLSPGDSVLLSAEAEGPQCGSLVCLSMHERYEARYQELCEQYTVDCDADAATAAPVPGDTFSYLNPSDGGWYRARCLTPRQAALLDAGRVVTLSDEDKMKPLPPKYESIPEFCCLLTAPGVKVGGNLSCKLLSKTADGYKVSLSDVESGADVGEGALSRWLPRVEHAAPPAPTAPPAPLAAADGYTVPLIDMESGVDVGEGVLSRWLPRVKHAAPPASLAQVSAGIPEVPRPDVSHNSRVLLVDATAADRAFVRPADAASQRRFDQTLEEVVLYARTASPLSSPPQKGQTVIGKFTDGLFYRALVKRTSVKQDKYLLEYIEFGNVEISTLENIFPCPTSLQLAARPTEASLVTLQCKCPAVFTQPAVEYLDKLKDDMAELVLTLPSGAKTAASGSAVCLAEATSNESVNRKLEAMCAPEWKKLDEQGADVVELKPLMYGSLECLELPAGGCTLDVLDVSALAEGSVSGCQSGLPQQERVLTRLTDQMAEYCNSELGREPYLPKFEELCIARFPPYPQWFRAVLLEQTPGSGTARVCYVDYGNVAEVPVALLRKMLPDFVRGLPALASHLEIKDFPKDPTPEMLARAVEYMQINEEGRGTLKVEKCERQEVGLYVVHAPGLLRAMAGH